MQKECNKHKIEFLKVLEEKISTDQKCDANFWQKFSNMFYTNKKSSPTLVLGVENDGDSVYGAFSFF